MSPADFDKRLVFYGGLTFRIESVTETFVGFAMYDDVKSGLAAYGHLHSFRGALPDVPEGRARAVGTGACRAFGADVERLAPDAASGIRDRL
jgi:hypothetical protein